MTRWITLGATALCLAPGTSAQTTGRNVDYASQIRPIFERNCYPCHGSATQQSGLRLDIGASAMRGGKSGPVIVPGKSAESRLYRLISGQAPGLSMPPGGPKLADRDIDLVRRWIDQGARWPGVLAGSAPAAMRPALWSLVPPVLHAVPRVKNAAWVRNPVDAFVLARLERAGLSPAPQADRRTLIRRLFLDLTGLPPSPTDVQAFVTDRSPDAYEKVVERLLASPHYGEHWARHWLDCARYADSNGYEKDNPRVMWKYRDWVIDALNRDMPYDRFVTEQLAGDMLPNATLDQRIATGFHRNTMINQEGGVDPEQFRWEAVHDRVATTGVVFLGLTLGCARCHDHKYDPLTQKDYYRMAAIYNSQDEPEIEAPTKDEAAKLVAIRTQISDLQKQRAARLDAIAQGWDQIEAALTGDRKKSLKPEALAILPIAPVSRTAAQRNTLTGAYAEIDPTVRDIDRQLAAKHAEEPKPPTAMVMVELSKPRETHVLIRGDFLNPGEVVQPGMPAVLPSLPVGAKADRLALARWLMEAKNPLTARVEVNRTWQAFFGRGLVATPEDFGTRGDKPSHPELLDWLAVSFRTGIRTPGKPAVPWSLRALQRLIVLSSTYRQSSAVSPALQKRDPYNVLLARGPRFRVDSETVRDIALTVSGLLNPAIGGPSVFPPQPEGVSSQSYGPTAWKTDTGPSRFRRGMYTFLKRTAPYPALMLFDAPTADTACTRRLRSNTPLQALVTLNDVVFTEAAQALAQRVVRECPGGVSNRMKYAFRLCTARDPDATEQARLLSLLSTQTDRFNAEPDHAAQLVATPAPRSAANIGHSDLAAWTVVARVLLNLDETMTKG